MSDVLLSGLALLAPELILVGMALVLLLAARRIQKAAVATVLTIMAALASGIVCFLVSSSEAEFGFGGMIVIDGYSQFFKILIIATLILISLLSAGSRHNLEIPQGEYHVLLLLASAGMMLSVSAHDLLILFLSLELMTLCSYILVGIRVERPAANEAAIKYFLLASFAAALLIYGISLTYGVTGSTDFAAIATAASGRTVENELLLFVAMALVLAGLAFKIAAVPFHAWAPDAYQGAPAPVAAFLATGSKAAGLAVLGRICLSAFPSDAHVWTILLAVLAGLSIVVGSVVALSQTDMKRLLAYSSISHAGYALLGLVAGTGAGASATMTYTFFYVFMTLGTFGVVIALGERGEKVDGYQGLAAQRPGMAVLMLIFLISLTGIPPTAGFAAKFSVILSAVRSGHIPLAILAVAFTVVSAFYYMRVAVLMYMKEPQDPAPARIPAAVMATLAVAALVTLLGGILPGILASWTISP